MTRLTITHEDYQNSQKSVSTIVSSRALRVIQGATEAEACQVHEFPEFTNFYDIEINQDKGNCSHTLRTQEECYKLIQESNRRVKEEEAQSIFDQAINLDSNRTLKIGNGEFKIQETDHSKLFNTALDKANSARINGEIFTIREDRSFYLEDDDLIFEIVIADPEDKAQSPVQIGDNTWRFIDAEGQRTIVEILEPSDELYHATDSIADTLLRVHNQAGIEGVKEALRSACLHFSAEKNGKDNPEADVDQKGLKELSDAILIPNYLKEANKTEIIFQRVHSLGETENIVSLIFLHDPTINRDDLVETLTAAVTKWVEETKEGQEMWEETCGDLNIGDLIGYLNEDGLQKYFQELGIFNIQSEKEASNLLTVSYDRILANPKEEEN